MSFGQQVIDFHLGLQPDWKLPKGIELIFPFDDPDTISAFNQFFVKYFSDDNPRTFLFGINPGRFGAGVTGIPFTDPKILEATCAIPNPFNKRNELSSIFIYEMIAAMGGPKSFYKDFYITSVSQLGFITNGKNINYYDDKKLEKAVRIRIIDNIQHQLTFGANRKTAFSIGQGQNLKFLKKLNDEHHFFEEIIPLPHPRWVMQYRLKSKEVYIDEYVTKLLDVLTGDGFTGDGLTGQSVFKNTHG